MPTFYRSESRSDMLSHMVIYFLRLSTLGSRMEKKREHTAFPTTVHTQQLWLVLPKKPGAEKNGKKDRTDTGENNTQERVRRKTDYWSSGKR